MNNRVRNLLLAATTLTIAVELISAVGWMGWKHLSRLVVEQPDEGAEFLSESPLLRLPSAVRRTRRLAARALGNAPDEMVISALEVLGHQQTRWAPAEPNGLMNLGRAQLIRGTIDDAAETLERAIVRDPLSPQLHRLIALAERARGRHEVTLDHLATAEGLAAGAGLSIVELTPEDAAWVRIAGLERHLDFYPRARVPGVLALAGELRMRGDEAAGRQLLSGDSNHPLIVLELADWDLDADLTVDAEERLDRLASRSGLPVSIRARTWGMIARARDQQGDADAALDAANQALRFDPTSPTPYLVLAGLCEKRGDLNAALDYLRRAWGMNPTDIGLLVTVAATAERAGNFDDARLALERAVAVDGDNPHLRVRLVDFHLRRGAFMDATVVLSSALDRFPTDLALLAQAERLRSEVSRR